MSTNATFKRGDYLRMCDVCGRGDLPRSKLRRRGNTLVCPDDYRGRTSQELDRANAAWKPKPIRPGKDAIGSDGNEIDVGQLEEAAIFDLIAVDGGGGVAPWPYLDVTNGDGFNVGVTVYGIRSDPTYGTPVAGAGAAAWSCIYLHSVIAEGKRPARWIARAKAKLRELADFLLTRQFGPDGSGAHGTVTTAAVAYGGFSYSPLTFQGFAQSTYCMTEDAAAGLIGLVRAWQDLGDTKYLVAARRVATFLRRAQCQGRLTTGYTCSDYATGLSRVHLGAWPDLVVVDESGGAYEGGNGSADYSPSGLLALLALSILKAADGDSTYGDATAVGAYASATAATLSQAIAEGRAFWQTGIADVTSVANPISPTGLVKTGLSSATPFAIYRALVQDPNFTTLGWGQWTNSPNGGLIASRSWAVGLHALYEYEGYSAQVSDVWEWLMGFASNPTYEEVATWSVVVVDESPQLISSTAVAASPAFIESSTHGTYDPTLCLSWEFDPSTRMNSTYYWTPDTFYDWSCFGLLAAIQSAKAASAFKRARDTAVVARKRFPSGTPTYMDNGGVCVGEQNDRHIDTILTRGKSGLGLQMSYTDVDDFEGQQVGRVKDVRAAAIIGLAFRQSPTMFGLKEEAI